MAFQSWNCVACVQTLYGVTKLLLAVLTLPLQNFLLGDQPALPGASPMNCTNNIPVALLALYFSLNVLLTFGTAYLLTRIFLHFHVLFDRLTAWIFLSSGVLLVAFNVVFYSSYFRLSF